MTDLMTLTATVIDKSTGPIASIEKSLAKMAETGKRTGRDLKPIFGDLSTEIRNVALPALQAFGITSLSLTGALAGLSGALRLVSDSAVRMNYFASSTRFSTKMVEEFNSVARSLKVDNPNAVLQTFADKMLQVRNNTTDAVEMANWMRQHNLGGMYEEMFNASKLGKFDTALEITMRAMRQLRGDQERAYFAQFMFGDRAAGKLAEFEQRQRQLGPLIKTNEEAAKKFDDQWEMLNRTIDNTRTSITNSLYEPLGKAVDQVNELLKLFMQLQNYKPEPSVSLFDKELLSIPGLGISTGGIDKWLREHSGYGGVGKAAPDTSMARRNAFGMFLDVDPGGSADQALKDPKTVEGQRSWWRKFIEGLSAAGVDVLTNGQLPSNSMPNSGGSASQIPGLEGNSFFSNGMTGAIPGAAGARNSRLTHGLNNSGTGGALQQTNTKLNFKKSAIAGDIVKQFRAAGMSDAGIAGILGNVQQESGFNPTLRHPDQPKWSGEAHFAHGLYQEGAQEWLNYAGWLKQNHPGGDWRDPHLQTEFMVHNLKHNKQYSGVWNRMKGATDPGQAAVDFSRGYLKPAAWAANNAGRAANARGFARNMPGEQDASPREMANTPASSPVWLNRRASADSERMAKALQGMMGKVEGSATIKVDVNAPRGTRVGAETGGSLFKQIELNRTGNMVKAPDGPDSWR